MALLPPATTLYWATIDGYPSAGLAPNISFNGKVIGSMQWTFSSSLSCYYFHGSSVRIPTKTSTWGQGILIRNVTHWLLCSTSDAGIGWLNQDPAWVWHSSLYLKTDRITLTLHYLSPQNLTATDFHFQSSQRSRKSSNLGKRIRHLFSHNVSITNCSPHFDNTIW